MTSKSQLKRLRVQRSARMTVTEAVEECNRWFAHLDTQRAKSVKIQELAALARTGPEGHAEAQKQLRQIDRHPKVFSGEKLEVAVKTLVDWVAVQSDFLSKL